MTVEEDAEEIVGLPLVPVVRRVDAEQRRDVRITIGRSHFQSHTAVVRDRAQRVDRVQFATGLVRVVHAADTQAQLEAQLCVVTQPTGDLQQVLAAHVQRQLVAVDDDFLDGVGEFEVVIGLQRVGQSVDHLVEVEAVGPRSALVDGDLADQSTVTRGVTAAADTKHAAAHADPLGVGGLDGAAADLTRRALGVVFR